MFENVTKQLETYMELGVPACDCIVYHQGKCIYRKYLGYSDRKNKKKMQGKELYNVYSCSKIITCTAALMLVERGQLCLEEKLSKYLEEFEDMWVKTEQGLKKAKKSITIKDLFCMTAGFTYDIHSPELERCRIETNGKCAVLEVMKYLAKEPLIFEPGESWNYSLCHDVLAAVIEVASGMRFGEFVKENIFLPLDMKNSTYLLDDSELDKLCEQYFFDMDNKILQEYSKANEFKLGTEYESGGAGCITTAEDYIKFLEGLRQGKLLSCETISLMKTNQIPENKRGNYWVDECGYGLGVRCPKEGSSRTDFGWPGAGGAYALVDMEKELTLFYVQHVRNFYRDDLRDQLYMALLKDLKME